MDETAALGVLEEMARKIYKERGFQHPIGFGKAPALVVVDLSNAFTDPESPLGSDLSAVVRETRTLVDAFRTRSLPIVFVTTGYHSTLQDAGLWILKIPSARCNVLGTRAVEIDRRLGRQDSDLLLVKKFASAFAGTGLTSVLTSLQVDTLVICGCSTSACIRATAEDSLANGFRPIVPRECVGDRAPGPHLWNLFDIDAKFGDVVSTADVQRYVDHLSAS